MFIEKIENEESVSLEDIPALIEEYQQALAKKDAQLIQQQDEYAARWEAQEARISSLIETNNKLRCAYTQELGRHKDTIHDLIVRQAADSAAYQQLMEKAVRFAQSVVDYDPYHDGKLKKEARALLKEREGT